MLPVVPPDPSVSLTVQRTPECLRVQVRGELDLATGEHLLALLTPLLAEAPALLVLDLVDVRFVDATGLRALLEAVRRQTRAGRRATVARPPAVLRRVVRVLELDAELPFEAR